MKPKFPGIKKSKSRVWGGGCSKQKSLAKVRAASSRQYNPAVSSTAQAARTLDLPATLLLHVVVLHLAAGRDAKRRARNGARGRVDDGDGVTGTLRHRLVQLHAVLVASGRRVERIRCGGQEE